MIVVKVICLVFFLFLYCLVVGDPPRIYWKSCREKGKKEVRRSLFLFIALMWAMCSFPGFLMIAGQFFWTGLVGVLACGSFSTWLALRGRGRKKMLGKPEFMLRACFVGIIVGAMVGKLISYFTTNDSLTIVNSVMVCTGLAILYARHLLKVRARA
jgi:predicted MFS family arabinose efflux permease